MHDFWVSVRFYCRRKNVYTDFEWLSRWGGGSDPQNNKSVNDQSIFRPHIHTHVHTHTSKDQRVYVSLLCKTTNKILEFFYNRKNGNERSNVGCPRPFGVATRDESGNTFPTSVKEVFPIHD